MRKDFTGEIIVVTAVALTLVAVFMVLNGIDCMISYWNTPVLDTPYRCHMNK